jgi:hypothetical protein
MRQSSKSFTTTPFTPSPASFSGATLSGRMAPGVGTGALTPVPGLPSFDPSALDPSAVSFGRLQQWVDILDRYLRLPTTFRDFVIYLTGLILIVAGATLHVYMAAQILQAKYERQQLVQQLIKLQEQNGDLVWKIARETNMAQLQQRVLAQGYAPIETREYVYAAPEHAPLATQPSSVDTPSGPTDALSAAAPARSLAAPASAARPPLEQWEAFFAFQWHPTPPTVDSAARQTASREQASASSSSDSSAGPATEPWGNWWRETLARGVKLLPVLTLPDSMQPKTTGQ